MILASVRDGSLDGRLVVVHPERDRVARLPGGFSSLLSALDRWDECEPKLRAIDTSLRAGTWGDIEQLSDVTLGAPLPRTWSFVDGSAFVQHVVLVRKARGAEPPPDLLTIPLMYQGASDNLLGPKDELPLIDPAHGMDFEAEIAVVTGSVPQGATADKVSDRVKLLLLMNDVSLRELIPREMGTGFGFFHSKPPSAFAPFALTPDELGSAWRDGRVHLPVESVLNGKQFGSPSASEMHFSFYSLIEHAARTRPLSAGTIVGSGTIANVDSSKGSSCIVERRMLEKIETGAMSTPYLSSGDRIVIRLVVDGVDLFGSIDQKVRGSSDT